MAPKGVDSKGPSYSGTNRNSGLIAITKRGIQMEPTKAAEYNALVKDYGYKFTPALKQNDGITITKDKEYYISQQYFVYFVEMKKWKRSGQLPEGLIHRTLRKI